MSLSKSISFGSVIDHCGFDFFSFKSCAIFSIVGSTGISIWDAERECFFAVGGKGMSKYVVGAEVFLIKEGGICDFKLEPLADLRAVFGVKSRAAGVVGRNEGVKPFVLGVS